MFCHNMKFAYYNIYILFHIPKEKRQYPTIVVAANNQAWGMWPQPLRGGRSHFLLRSVPFVTLFCAVSGAFLSNEALLFSVLRCQHLAGFVLPLPSSQFG